MLATYSYILDQLKHRSDSSTVEHISPACDYILPYPKESGMILIQAKHNLGQGKTLAFVESAIENLTQSTFETLKLNFPYYEVGPACTDIIDNAIEATCTDLSPVILVDGFEQVVATPPCIPQDEEQASYSPKLIRQLRQLARNLVRSQYRWLFALKKKLIRILRLLPLKKQWQRRHCARASLICHTLSSDDDSHFFNLIMRLSAFSFMVKEVGIHAYYNSTLRAYNTEPACMHAQT